MIRANLIGLKSQKLYIRKEIIVNLITYFSSANCLAFPHSLYLYFELSACSLSLLRHFSLPLLFLFYFYRDLSIFTNLHRSYVLPLIFCTLSCILQTIYWYSYRILLFILFFKYHVLVAIYFIAAKIDDAKQSENIFNQLTND